MPGSLSHLTKRFLDYLLSKPLGPSEVDQIQNWVTAGLAEIFFEQPQEDQRHGYHAALVVVADASAGPDVIEAALMHDIGKRHASLGIIGRSVASVMIRLRFRLPRRMVIYKDHGPTGAEDLTSAGASRLSVEFAKHHHGQRPANIDPNTWDLLQLADQPPNPRSLIRSEITSTTE